MSEYLDVIPLGGIGEFGMNCTVLRYNDEMILIDAGLKFPERTPGSGLGIDVIVPDFSFLEEHSDQLRAILLTHGHEDHAGGVAYITGKIPVPVYATPFTLALVRERLNEHHLSESTQLHSVQARKPFEVGSFQIEPLHVTHSFPDSLCFAISTPAGSLIWTGDFKFDQTPVDKKLSDLDRLAHYGEKGVLALFSDSTNSAMPGLSPSEFTMYNGLRSFFLKADCALIITCFASSIHRIQIVLDIAQEFNRKVLLLGRSMIKNVQIAADLNYLHFPEDLLISPGKAAQIPRHKLTILASGSQGEPRAAMSRLANNEVKKIGIEAGDIAILSARVIPGNEKLIGKMVNNLYRRGARVFDSRSSQVHASGHGLEEDLKLMLNLTKPHYFIPIHGEFRQLKTHSNLARDQGIPEERIQIIENGDVLRITRDSAEIKEKIQVGKRFINQGTLGEAPDIILRDRSYLSENGLLVIALQLDSAKRNLIAKPKLVSRGFVLMETSEKLMEAISNKVTELIKMANLDEKQDEESLKRLLQKQLKRFLGKQTGKRPIIIPIIINE